MAKSDLSTEVVFDPDVTNVDGDAINAQMMGTIAAAESFDDILNSNVGTVEKLREILNANGGRWEGVNVLSVSFNEASEEFQEGGWGFYAVMQVSDSDGIVHTVSTGAKTIVLKLYQLDKHGHIPTPNPVMFVSNRTRAGYTVLDMRGMS